MLKSIFTLLLLTIALPFSFVVVLFCSFRKYLYGLKVQHAMQENDDPKTILISGGKMTKALHLARTFHRAGHRVILVESQSYWVSGHRFSNTVSRFYTIPDSGTEHYEKALLDIVRKERVNVYIPVCSPVASIHDSALMPSLQRLCEVIHVTTPTIFQLDNKYLFFQAAQRFNLKVPKSFLITDHSQVINFDFSGEKREYILKSIAYDPVRRLQLTRLPGNSRDAMIEFVNELPISEDNPWILQEFIVGEEFCTHGMFRDGHLRVHCACPSSAFQVNYEHKNISAIEDWVRQFGFAMKLTGQASYDFIKAEDDAQFYAIECNPRTHSAITLFGNYKRLSSAYLDKNPKLETEVPQSEDKPTYWLFHELWRVLSNLHRPQIALQRLNIIYRGRDAVFDQHDPFPFLMLHHWHIPLLLVRSMVRGKSWEKIDFNIGKLVQANGD
jgi:hypothetical protein